MLQRTSLPLLLALGALSTGCASITGGQNQSLSVETRADGQVVAGASCKLENDKGTWFTTSPGTAVVRRSYDDLNVRCEKDGHEPGITAAKSSTKAMAFGNIIFGGVIGAAVDMGSGAAYDYPTIIAVELGKNRVQEPERAPQTEGGQDNPTDSVGAAGGAQEKIADSSATPAPAGTSTTN